jgi:hypothetical protein
MPHLPTKLRTVARWVPVFRQGSEKIAAERFFHKLSGRWGRSRRLHHLGDFVPD